MLSLPINIKYEKHVTNNIIYEYKLLLHGEKIGLICIENETNSKYIDLIEPLDEIKLNDIDSFSLHIELNSYDYSYRCDINGELDNNTLIFINKDLYIEFSSNQSGLTLATCCYKGNDNEKLFMSPP